MSHKRRANQPDLLPQEQNHLDPRLLLEEQPGIPGDPGFRTRGMRSGLDPLDSSFEAARIVGVFLRRLFTLRLRTHNPAYLALLALGGALGLSLTVALFDLALQLDLLPGTQALVFLSALAALIFSLALLANLAFSEMRHRHA